MHAYERVIEIFTVAASLVLYSAAFLHYLSLLNQGAYPASWIQQSPVVLMVIAAAYAGFLLSVKRENTYGVLFSFLTLLTAHVLIGYAAEGAILLRFLLLMVLTILAAGRLSMSLGVPLVFLSLCVVVFFEGERATWDSTVSATPVSGVLAMVVVLMIVAFLSFGVRWVLNGVLHKQRLHDDLVSSLSDLVSVNLELQEYATHSEERSRRAERNRIARDIHDTVGYSLTNLIMMLEAGQDLIDRNPGTVSDFLERMKNHAQEALQETRRSLRELRATQEIGPQGMSAIHKLLQTINSATNIRVLADYGNMPLQLSRIIEITLFRLIQEGITNAIRHGHADVIRVSFWSDGASIQLTMQDNGLGQQAVENELQEGIGLQGLRERIEAVGGQLFAHPLPNGFQLIATIPFKTSIGVEDE